MTGVEHPRKSALRTFVLRCGFASLVLAVCFAAFLLLPWWKGPLRALQFSASDIRDEYDGRGSGITGDFTRRIRAHCTEDAFHCYAFQQGLTARLEEELPPRRMRWSRSQKKWWTPPSNCRGAYHLYREGGERRLLAYADEDLSYEIDVW